MSDRAWWFTGIGCVLGTAAVAGYFLLMAYLGDWAQVGWGLVGVCAGFVALVVLGQDDGPQSPPRSRG